MTALGTPNRRTTVLAGLALGIAGLAVGAASWATVTARDGLDATVAVDVAGRAVAPGVTAGAVVVVAAALALTLAGRWAAPVAAAVVAGGGLLQLGSAVLVLRSPEGLERAARRAALEQVGVDALTGTPQTGALPWLAVGVGVLTVLLGAVAVVAGRRWTADRRHTSDLPGTDPSGPVTGPATADHDDDPAVWDRLSRGDDPS